MTDIPMHCDACREIVPQLVTGQGDDLDPTLRESAWRHLRDCATCRSSASECLSGLALLGMALDPEAVPADFSDRIRNRLAQAAGSPGASSAQPDGEEHPAFVAVANPTASSPRATLSPLHRWLSYGLAGGLLVAAMGWQFVYLYRARVASEAIQEPQLESGVEDLEKALADLQASEAQARASRVRFVEFESPSEGVSVRAHAVWDDVAAQLHLFAYEMPVLESGEVYAVWMRIGDSPPVLLDTFIPDGSREVSRLLDGPPELRSEQSSATTSPAQKLEILVTVESTSRATSPSKRLWVRAAL